MNDYNTIALLIQWGIVGFFVLFNLLIGFFRGTKRTSYYTAVSILLTFVVLWLISLLTIRVLPESFIVQMIDKYVPLSDEIKSYLTSQDILPMLIAIVDFVVKIVGFFILYPLVKWLLTVTIFRAIGKRLVPKNKYANNSNKTYVLHKQKLRPYKKPRVTLLSRTGGAFIGAFRGFIVGFIFLLPVIVLASFFGQVGPNAQTVNDNDLPQIEYSDEVLEVFSIINDFNDKGLGRVATNIQVGDKNLGESMFDFVFTTKIVKDGEKVDLELGQEFKSVIKIVKATMEMGVVAPTLSGQIINPDFDVNNVSKRDLPYMEVIFDELGNSKLLANVIPIAVNIGLEQFEDLTLNETSKSIINDVKNIEFNQEFDNIYKVLANVLEIGSVGELLSIVENQSIEGLTQDDLVSLSTAFKSLTQLKLLSLANVGLDYALTLEDFHNLVTWVDEEDREDALREYFKFALNNKNYFTSSAGVFAQLSEVLEIIANDDNSLDIISAILEDFEAVENYYQEDTVDLISNILIKVLTNDLVLDSIPFVVDYAVFEALKDQIDLDEIGNDLSNELSEHEWTTEINNITDIYRKLANFALDGYFNENLEYYQIIDNLIQDDNMDDLKLIINKAIGESSAVNKVLQIAAPTLVNNFVEDEALKDVVLELIDQDDDFKYGQELVDVLDIASVLLSAVSMQEVFTIDFNEVGNILWILSKVSDRIGKDKYDELVVDKLVNLQLINRTNENVLNYVFDQTGLDTSGTVMPTNLNIGRDLTRVLNILYEASDAVNTAFVNGGITGTTSSDDVLEYAKTINLTNLLTQGIQDQLTFDNIDLSESILLSIAVGQLQGLENNESFGQYLVYPDSLIDYGVDSEWVSELNALTGILFDVARAYQGDSGYAISINNIENISTDYKSINLDMFTRFSDEVLATQTFRNIGESRILSSSIITLAEEQLTNVYTQLGIDTQFVVPEELIENDKIRQDDLTGLIHSLALLAFELNNTYHLETINDALNIELDTKQLVNAFNRVSTNAIDKFGSNLILAHILNDALEDYNIQNFAIDQLNNLEVNIEGNVLGNFDYSFLRFSNLNIYDFRDLLVGVHNLQFDADLISNFTTNELFDYVGNLSDSQITDLFGGNLVSFLVTKVLNSNNVLELGTNLANTYYTDFVNNVDPNSQLGAIKDLNVDFDSLVRRINTITKVHHGQQRFDHEELLRIKHIIFDINQAGIDFDNLEANDIEVITDKLYDFGAYYSISQSRILRAYLAEVLYEQPSVITWATSFIEDMLAEQEVEIELGNALEFSRNYLDFNNELEATVIEELLVGTAAQNLSLYMKGEFNNKEVITTLLDKPFKQTTKDRISYLYDIRLFNDILVELTDENALNDIIANIANEFVIDFSTQLNFTPVYFAGEDIGLAYDHFDELSIRQIVQVVSKLEFEEFAELSNLENATNVLQIDQSRDLLDEIFGLKLINFVVTQAFKQDVVFKIAAELLNERLLVPNGLASVDPAELRFDDQFLISSEYTNLVLALYFSNIENFNEFSPQTLRDLEQLVTVGNYEQGLTRFDYLLNANIVYSQINMVLNSKGVKEGLSDFINSQLENLLNASNVFEPEAFNIPDHAKDENGWLIKDDPKALLSAFNALNLQSFNELSQLVDINSSNFIRNKNYVGVTENLLESKWMYHVINANLTSNKAREDLASIISQVVSNNLNINHTFTANDFDFTNGKYQLINEQGNLSKVEIVNLVKAAFVIDPKDIQIDGLNTVTNILGLLNEEDVLTEQTNFEAMLESNFLYAIFDLALNVKYNQTTYNDFYIKLVNSFIPSNLDFTLTKQDKLLEFSNQTYEDGLITKEALFELVEGAGTLDLSGELGIETIERLVGQLGEDNDDFAKLFGGKIILSLISNATQSQNVKSLVAKLANDNQTFITIEQSDISIPDKLYEDGLLSVNDLRDLFIGAYVLYSEIGLSDLSIYVTQQLEFETEYKGRNKTNLRYVLDADLLYLSLDHVLQSDKFADTVSDLIVKEVKARFDLDIEVDRSAFVAPLSALDSNGVILKNEFETILSGFNKLELVNNEDLTRLIDINDEGFIRNKDYVGVTEDLLDSNWVYHALNVNLTSVKIRELLADVASDLVSTNLNINHTFTEKDFDFTDSKYLLFDNQNKVLKSEIINLVKAAFVINPAEVQIDGLNTVTNILGLLNEEDVLTEQTNFEAMLESNFLYAIFDLALNVKYNQTTYNDFYIKLVNSFIPSNLDFTLTKEDRLFVFDESTYQDQIITKDSLVELVTSANLVDLSGGVSIYTIQELVGYEGEEDDDFAKLFGGKIVLSLISNATRSQSAKQLIANLVNERQGYINLETSYIYLPEQLYSNGLLQVSDLRDLFIGAYVLFTEFDLNHIGIHQTQQLTESSNYKGRDKSNLMHVLDANILYYVFDNAIQSEKLSETLIYELEQLLFNRLDVSINIPERLLNAPASAKDANGILLKSEVVSIVEAFNKLEILDLSELRLLIDRNSSDFIRNKDYVGFTEALLNSNWVYEVINEVSKSEEIRIEVAKVASRVLKSVLDIDHTFTANDFDLTGDKYSIFDTNDNIIKDEIVELVKAIFVIDTAEIEIAGLNTVFNLLELLNKEVDTNKSSMDVMLESNIVYAVIERLANTKYNETTYLALYKSIFNNFVSRIVDLNVDEDSEIFNFNDNVYQDELMKKEEISLFVRSLGYVDSDNYRNLNVLHLLIGRNEEAGIDDFERMFESLILRSVITNVSKDDELLQQVVDILNNRQSQAELDLDIIKPSAYIYDADGLILTSEIRATLIAVEILGLLELDFGNLGVDTITDAIGRNMEGGVDDLDRIFASTTIYTTLARLIGSDILSDKLSEMLSEMLDKDINYVDTKPLASHLGNSGRELGLIKYSEIRSLLEGVKLLGITGMPDSESVNLASILDMIDRNVVAGVDDLDRFLASDYLVYLLAKMLESNSIKELLASSADFDIENFDLVGASRKDGYLDKDEVANIFIALDLLGISDFGNIGFEIQTLKTLTDDDLEQILLSTYLYQVIDLSIKDKLDDVPNNAYTSLGNRYEGYVLKTEIIKLINVLKIVDAEDFSDIDAAELETADLRAIVDLESHLIDRLISTELIAQFTDIPEASYKVDSEEDEFGKKLDLSRDEIYDLLESIEILGQTKASDLDNLDGATLEVDKLGQLVALDSPLINRVISTGIIESGFATDKSYVVESANKDIKPHEIIKLIEALELLNVATIGDLEDLSFVKLQQLTPYDAVTIFESNKDQDDETSATIVYYLSSEIIISAVDEALIPDEKFVDPDATEKLLTRIAITELIS